MRRMIRAWFSPENGKGSPASEPSENQNNDQTIYRQYTRFFGGGKRDNPGQRAVFLSNALQLAGLKERPRPLPLAPARPTGNPAPIDWKLPFRPRAVA